jgi:hypothetical protein
METQIRLPLSNLPNLSLAMPVLTSTTTATSLVRPRSQARGKTEAIGLLQPALSSLHRLLSMTAFIICTCVVQLCLFLFQTARFLLQNAVYVCKVFTINVVVATRFGAAAVWKRTERVRRKLFFEFMVWILNPNAVMLFIFWPGWIVLLGFLFVFWCLD